MPHWRAGNVKWRCAAVFSGAGVLGAFAGAAAAKALDGQKLLTLFGFVMVVVGAVMLRKRDAGGNPDVRLSSDTARELLPFLLGIGFAVGLFSGFFGIGGGFNIRAGLSNDRSSGRAIIRSIQSGTISGAALHENFMPMVGQLSDRGRYNAKTIFVILALFRNSDEHTYFLLRKLKMASGTASQGQAQRRSWCPTLLQARRPASDD